MNTSAAPPSSRPPKRVSVRPLSGRPRRRNRRPRSRPSLPPRRCRSTTARRRSRRPVSRRPPPTSRARSGSSNLQFSTPNPASDGASGPATRETPQAAGGGESGFPVVLERRIGDRVYAADLRTGVRRARVARGDEPEDVVVVERAPERPPGRVVGAGLQVRIPSARPRENRAGLPRPSGRL